MATFYIVAIQDMSEMLSSYPQIQIKNVFDKLYTNFIKFHFDQCSKFLSVQILNNPFDIRVNYTCGITHENS